MNILLLNDTAVEPHVGCLAVSDAHARMLGAAGHVVSNRYFLGELRGFSARDEAVGIQRVLHDNTLRAQIEAADAVVVNGEGTLHHGAGTEYFAILGAAQQLKKMTLIVNAVFEAHTGWLGVLSRLDDFCVRDQASLLHAQSHGLRCRLVPDSVLGAQFHKAPLMHLDHRIVVTDWHPARESDVGAALRIVLSRVDGAFYYPLQHGMQEHLWRHAPATWARAEWVFTARHHGVYLAVLAERPFVPLPSNTRKIEGLLQAAGVSIPMCTTVPQIEAAMLHAMEHMDEYQKLRQFLLAEPLTTFQCLGQGSAGSDVARELARLERQKAGKSWALQPVHWGLGAPGLPRDPSPT